MDIRCRNRFVNLATVTLMCVFGLLAACTPNTTATAPTPTPLRPPQVTFDAAPETLCQAATQLRLAPEALEVWPITVKAQWTLRRAGESAALSAGEWQPGMGELFVAFPKGAALPPDRYTLALHADGVVLGEHTFTITDETAAITALDLALTPSGPALTRLSGGARHFYLRFAYQGACPGAPYWIAVRHASSGDIVCTHSATLSLAEGAESVACFRKDGAPLADGDYHAELTLMGRTQHTLDFIAADELAPTPTATATPIPTSTPAPPPPLVCAPPFAAAGLMPEGEPFLPQERFEWYSQVIYVGTQCEGLQAGTTWESTWFRDSVNVRTAGGVWNETDGAGVVWDSITGIPAAPFLLPGEYTVTLTLDGTEPLTATFRLIAYVKPEPEPATQP